MIAAAVEVQLDAGGHGRWFNDHLVVVMKVEVALTEGCLGVLPCPAFADAVVVFASGHRARVGQPGPEICPIVSTANCKNLAEGCVAHMKSLIYSDNSSKDFFTSSTVDTEQQFHTVCWVPTEERRIERESTFVTFCTACTQRKREEEGGERSIHLLTKQTVQERQIDSNPGSSASVGEHSTSTPPPRTQTRPMIKMSKKSTTRTPHQPVIHPWKGFSSISPPKAPTYCIST